MGCQKLKCHTVTFLFCIYWKSHQLKREFSFIQFLYSFFSIFFFFNFLPFILPALSKDRKTNWIILLLSLSLLLHLFLSIFMFLVTILSILLLSPLVLLLIFARFSFLNFQFSCNGLANNLKKKKTTNSRYSLLFFNVSRVPTLLVFFPFWSSILCVLKSRKEDRSNSSSFSFFISSHSMSLFLFTMRQKRCALFLTNFGLFCFKERNTKITLPLQVVYLILTSNSARCIQFYENCFS